MDLRGREELVAERVARNDAAFRDANERIREKAEELELGHGRIPFICECAEATCREIIRVPVEEYREIRRNRRHFLNVPGHQRAAEGYAVVVAERDGYVIVEKVGRAGDLVEDLGGTDAGR